MPRNRRPTNPPPVEQLPPEELPRRPFFTEPDPSETVLAEIQESFGTGAKVEVKIYIIKNGTEQYVHTFQNWQDATEDNIRKLGYGPGEYLRKVIVNGVYKMTNPCAIAEKVEAVAILRQDSAESTVIQMMRDHNAQMQSLLTAVLTRGSGGPQESISALVTAVAQMMALNKPPDQIDTIMKYIDLGKTLAGGGGGDDGEGLMSIVKDVAKAAAPALVPMLMRGAQAPPQLPQEPPRNVTPPPNGADVNAEQIQLKLGIDYLKKKCMAGADPNLYTAFICDNYDQPQFKKLVDTVATQDFSTFTAIDPAIAKEPFAKFFRAIYDGIRSAIDDANKVEPATGGANGHAPDPPVDGGTGSRKRNKPSA